MTDNTNRRASPKESEGLELPPLPKALCLLPGVFAYRASDMSAYAREAVASLKAASDAAIALAGETIAARNAEIAELREAVEADRLARAAMPAQAGMPQPAPAATIDTLAFRVLLNERDIAPNRSLSEKANAALIAHIDAKLAEARRAREDA